MDGQLILSAATLTTLTIEGLKWLVRRFIVQDPGYTFPTVYYDCGLPFFTAVFSIALGAVGWADPVVFEWASLLQWALSIVATLMLYHMGVQPYISARD